MTEIEGNQDSPRIDPPEENQATASEYIKWVEYQLNAGLEFAPLKEAIPEIARQARVFDAACATIFRGQATVFACKVADNLTYTQVAWHLNQLLDLVPKPGSLDAIGYYGALILIFEKHLDDVKRDRLLKMAKRRWFHSGLVQVILVDLTARATWRLDIPKSVQLLLWPLEDALSRNGEPPPLKKIPHRLGSSGWKAPINYMTMALIAVLGIVHVLVFLSTPEDSLGLRLFRSGARHSRAILDGEFWRILTQAFLHADWGHFVINLAGLFEFGRLAEPLLGGGWVLAMFFATGLAGTIFSWALVPGTLGVGASACVYGLFGVVGSIYLFRRENIAFHFQGYFARIIQVFIVFSVLIVLLSVFLGSRIDFLAHLGSFIAGGMMAFLLPLREKAGGQMFGRAVGMVMAGLSIFALGAAAGHRDPALQRYFPTGHNDLGITFERPVAFSMKPLPDRPGFVMANNLGARTMMCNLQESYVWMLERGADSLIEEFRQRLEGYDLLEVTEIVLGDFKAIDVRYLGSNEADERMIEDIYIPRRGGTLYISLSSPKRDSVYYLPIFSRIKSSLESRVPPPINLPPALNSTP